MSRYKIAGVKEWKIIKNDGSNEIICSGVSPISIESPEDKLYKNSKKEGNKRNGNKRNKVL